MQTAANMGSVLKEGWSSDRLVAQFEAANKPLGKLKAYRGEEMGRQVRTPILYGRSGAFTTVGSSGGNLNPALQQTVAAAIWTMPYNWFQYEIDTSALVQSGDNIQSIVAGKDLEIKGSLENASHQISRMVVTNSDGVVVAMDNTTTGNTVIKVINAATEGASYGYSALVRGWVGPNQPISIGTTGAMNSLTSALTAGAFPYGGVAWITAVDKTPSAPTITVHQALGTVTAGTHFGFIPDPNGNTGAANQVTGIRAIIGNAQLAGIDPAGAGNEYWQGAARDVTTTTFSLDLALNLQRLVMQNSNNAPAAIWTGYKQQMNFYSLLQSQVQFAGDGNLAAGKVDSPTWNGMTIDAMADILDTDWFMLTPADMFRIKGNLEEPRWASDLQGAGSMVWKPGTTKFTDGVVYPVNLGCQRRNTQAGALNLK